MAILKHYSAEKFKKRYSSYRILFAVYGMLFIAAYAAGTILIKASGESFDFSGVIGPKLVFTLGGMLLGGKILAFAAVFALGITVYAPISGAVGAVVLGLRGGAELNSVLTASGESEFAAGLCWIFASAAAATVFVAFASFCSCVSLRLFSDGISAEGAYVDEEGRCFGGLLFNSVLFRNTVNIRFLVSYICAFAAALAVQYIIYSISAALLLLIL